MKAQKVVKIEVLDDCEGVELIFGIEGERGGANTNAAIAAAVGAKTSDEEMAVSRRVASLVFKKALKQDRTGRISAP